MSLLGVFNLCHSVSCSIAFVQIIWTLVLSHTGSALYWTPWVLRPLNHNVCVHWNLPKHIVPDWSPSRWVSLGQSSTSGRSWPRRVAISFLANLDPGSWGLAPERDRLKCAKMRFLFICQPSGWNPLLHKGLRWLAFQCLCKNKGTGPTAVCV